jgi:hypothetical protein
VARRLGPGGDGRDRRIARPRPPHGSPHQRGPPRGPGRQGRPCRRRRGVGAERPRGPRRRCPALSPGDPRSGRDGHAGGVAGQ